MNLRNSVAGLVIWLWLMTPELPGQYVPMTIEQMTQAASVVLQGKVVNKSEHADEAGRIYTRVEIQVVDLWKGTVPANPIQVVHGGGTVGRKTMVVSHQVEYPPGEEVVAFLVVNPRGDFVTLGMAQGKFIIWSDPATGLKLARNIFHGVSSTRNTSASKQKAAPGERLTLGELKSRVKGARQ